MGKAPSTPPKASGLYLLRITAHLIPAIVPECARQVTGATAGQWGKKVLAQGPLLIHASVTLIHASVPLIHVLVPLIHVLVLFLQGQVTPSIISPSI